ncbi:MAG: ubiquinone/menaquinone biosynthesis methyltransferase [Actinomycetota bacterium]
MPDISDRPTGTERERRVRAMFDSIVGRYDIVNDGLSLGLDRRWRSVTARALAARAGDVVLDLGAGTGKLSAQLSGGVRVVGVDLSLPMLAVARERCSALHAVQGSASRLPFLDASFDGAMSAFVLRNLADLQPSFAELARVVRPRGRIALVDITQPPRAAVRVLFNGYFGAAAPLLGRLVGRADAYRYLARSVSTLPAAEEVCRMLAFVGFVACRARRMAGGVTTLWTAARP